MKRNSALSHPGSIADSGYRTGAQQFLDQIAAAVEQAVSVGGCDGDSGINRDPVALGGNAAGAVQNQDNIIGAGLGGIAIGDIQGIAGLFRQFGGEQLNLRLQVFIGNIGIRGFDPENFRIGLRCPAGGGIGTDGCCHGHNQDQGEDQRKQFLQLMHIHGFIPSSFCSTHSTALFSGRQARV